MAITLRAFVCRPRDRPRLHRVWFAQRADASTAEGMTRFRRNLFRRGPVVIVPMTHSIYAERVRNKSKIGNSNAQVKVLRFSTFSQEQPIIIFWYFHSFQQTKVIEFSLRHFCAHKPLTSPLRVLRSPSSTPPKPPITRLTNPRTCSRICALLFEVRTENETEFSMSNLEY